MPATLESRFPFIIAEMRPRLSAAVKAGAEEVAVLARARAPQPGSSPYATGALRDSIHVKATGVGAEYAVIAGNDDEVFYGHMIEFGTIHDPAQPFLIPATEEATPEIIAVVTAVLRAL